MMIDRISCEQIPANCQHVDAAADKAIKKTFAMLGVDVDDPQQVEAFRQDLRFGASMRKVANHGWLAFIAVAAAGSAWAMLAGILAKVKGG